jgi:hypothetical protein
LYPHVIKTKAIPVGHPTYFEGDPNGMIDMNRYLVFAQVKVTAPLDIKIPILLHRIVINGVITTITPKGT